MSLCNVAGGHNMGKKIVTSFTTINGFDVGDTICFISDKVGKSNSVVGPYFKKM